MVEEIREVTGAYYLDCRWWGYKLFVEVEIQYETTDPIDLSTYIGEKRKLWVKATKSDFRELGFQCIQHAWGDKFKHDPTQAGHKSRIEVLERDLTKARTDLEEIKNEIKILHNWIKYIVRSNK